MPWRPGFGAVDVLVNNAGRGLAAEFEDTTPEEFRALLELNLVAVVTASQAVLPLYAPAGAGPYPERLLRGGAPQPRPAAPPTPRRSSRWWR